MTDDFPAKGYEPHEVEKKWYAYWEREGLFSARETDDKKPYAIVIPPPNVTGVLHMGHALNNTMQDILCRYRRLCGDNVLWMPGTDHAGIATQNVVERKLAEKGMTRHELGREKFIEAVWEWRKTYGSAIINQLKRLGASCDWERERFTMDEGLSRAVRKVFVTLYEQGHIYRGDYIINWCHRCYTALSDLEVEHEDKPGHLYHIAYPFADDSGEIVVVTTRPETMLGDTAVAVHPDDERYQGLTVDSVILPLMDREIPIIRDAYVDMDFGSGGLKVTPAHDINDFEIGNRHDLKRVKVIGDDGLMTEAAGRFAGMEIVRCRKAVVAALKESGYLKKIEDHVHSVGHCYRCKKVVEPNLSKQWFVAVKPLAEKAVAAVREGKTVIVPEMWNRNYFEWMENIRDWCISRQIWWGHRIPAWYCRGCGKIIVAVTDPDTCDKCGSSDLKQETDVLDTWFSSALWPFSTMGWPDDTPLLKTFYPTSVLITGFDILFFWVARMMMMGIHFMGEVPFSHVYVHALVRDENGGKMSKSTGNVIDPLTVIEQYGTDAFRFTLAAFAAQGRDVKMSEKRVEGYRHFVNKIWNAARFALMHVKKGYEHVEPNDLSLYDQWILNRLAAVTKQAGSALDDYRFNDAASALYQFVWHEFCDWYLEMIKPTLYGDLGKAAAETTRAVLWRVMRDILILLHPFMPFVTEEIWHHLPGAEGSIMKAAFPLNATPDATHVEYIREDAVVNRQMERLIQVISGIRNIRGEMNIAPALKLTAQVRTEDAALLALLSEQSDCIRRFAGLETFTATPPGEPPDSSATAVMGDAVIYVPLAGVIDFDKETVRLEKKRGKLAKDLEQVNNKLENPGFLNNAPETVQEKIRNRRETLSGRMAQLDSHLARLNALKR